MGCVLPCNDDFQESSDRADLEIEVVADPGLSMQPTEVTNPLDKVETKVEPKTEPIGEKKSEPKPVQLVQTKSEPAPVSKPEPVAAKPAPAKKGKKDLDIQVSPVKQEQSALVEVLTPINAGTSNSAKVTENTAAKKLAVKLDLDDVNSIVFKGTSALQKFSNKTTYEKRFLWVNLYNSTLNLSEYMTKEKRHKEVNVKDIVSVAQTLPAKADKKLPEKPSVDQCLTVNFTRGGGIDIKFESSDQRDLWFETLTKLRNNAAQ